MLERLSLDRPLAFIDLETTGLSTVHDRIVEMALIRVEPDGSTIERVRRFNPEIPIPREASAVHGITDADVAGEAPFRQRARSLFELLDPCDLAGFNIRRFDIPMLLAEFFRAGVEFDPRTRRIVDMQQIFHREEPRDLSAATRFYLERELDDAHSALADIRASAEILDAQMERYPHLPTSVDALHAYCDDVGVFRTELDRWFDRGEDGALVFRRGKHKGKRLDAMARMEPDYLHWMTGAEDMPLEVVRAVVAALDEAAGQASNQAPGPPPAEGGPPEAPPFPLHEADAGPYELP